MILLYSGLALYAVAAVFAFHALRTGDGRGMVAARIGGAFGALDHAAFLVQIGVTTGRFPVTGALEAYVFLSTAIVAVALILDWQKGRTILLVGTLPLAAVTTLLAIALSVTPEPPPGTVSPPVDGVLTSLHVFTALGSYGAFSVAFVSGILFLVVQRQLKGHAAASILGLLPPLETVARINRHAVGLGVALLAGGLLVGYFQARRLLGVEAWWRNDPKIYLTTLTLALYVALLVLGSRPSFKGRRAAVASVLGFFLVMATFWASVFWSGFHRFH